MANVIAVLFLSFTTNCNSINSLPDGSRLCAYEVVATVEVNHGMPDGNHLKFKTEVPYTKFSRVETTSVPLPPPGLPLPGTQAPPLPQSRFAPPPPPTTGGPSFPLLPPRFANGGPDEENFCRMFRIDFPTVTNRIYGLESTVNMVTWDLCPPEVDGTGAQEVFFDANNGGRSYRVTSREGVLPPDEDPLIPTGGIDTVR